MPVSLSLSADTPLVQRRNRAEERLKTTRQEHYHVQMIDVARIVRAALPEAATIDLARDLFDIHDEVWLEAVRAADGMVLWHAEQAPDPLAAFRYADGASWAQATEVIVETIGHALAGVELADAAHHRPSSSGPVNLFRFTLPERRVVERYVTTPDPGEPRDIAADDAPSAT